MIRLKVPPQKAESLIDSIAEKCRTKRPQYWEVGGNGNVSFSSVCWLFCWSCSGGGSQGVATEARRIFDAILTISFDEFKHIVGYENSQKCRRGYDELAVSLAAKVAEHLRTREESAQDGVPEQTSWERYIKNAHIPAQARNFPADDDVLNELAALRDFKKTIVDALKRLDG
jgi:hypothetical protein